METWFRGELQPMIRTPLFASSDPLETKRQTVSAFKEHELAWRDGKVDSALYRADLGALTFFVLRYGAAVHIEPGQLKHFMLFQVPLTGTARIRAGDRVVSASPRMGALISPTLPLDIEWDRGCEQMLLKIPRERVEDACRALIGGDLHAPIEFTPEMPLDNAVGRSWQHQLAATLCNLDPSNRSLPGPLLRVQEEALVHHLLLRHASNYSARLLQRPAAVPPRKIRLAEHYIQAHLHDALTLGAIASACGASVRSLCLAFREHYQLSPMAYVRMIRLEGAHNELHIAQPGANVTDIALRWGFNHLGRFCTFYRERYGETPRQTLRR